jgi:hypothetical protein
MDGALAERPKPAPFRRSLVPVLKFRYRLKPATNIQFFQGKGP